MGTTDALIAVLDKGQGAVSKEADLQFAPSEGWRIFRPRDRFPYPAVVERIAEDLVRAEDGLGIVAMVEDSDWAYVAGLTPDGVVARFLIHPDGAEGYEEGEQVLTSIQQDHTAQADGLSMFAMLAGRRITTERILQIEESDDVFAEQPMFVLLDELGIDLPNSLFE